MYGSTHVNQYMAPMASSHHWPGGAFDGDAWWSNVALLYVRQIIDNFDTASLRSTHTEVHTIVGICEQPFGCKSLWLALGIFCLNKNLVGGFAECFDSPKIWPVAAPTVAYFSDFEGPKNNVWHDVEQKVEWPCTWVSTSWDVVKEREHAKSRARDVDSRELDVTLCIRRWWAWDGLSFDNKVWRTWHNSILLAIAQVFQFVQSAVLSCLLMK